MARFFSVGRTGHRFVALVLASLIGPLVAAAESTIPPPLPAPAEAAAAPKTSPNQALAGIAKEVLVKSLKPEYEKVENWGHQKEIVDGYRWAQHPEGWRFEKQTKKVNDGLWRMYKVRLDNPRQNLQLRLTSPRPADQGRTALQAILSARVGIEARQERWVLGVKGLNFQVAGEATVEARLDIVIGVQTVKGGSFGSIEVQPVVSGVGLRLVDLTLKQVDLIHGDAARELGHAVEDILAGELHKREPEVTARLNAEIQKHREKLQFSPAQIAEIGWEKIGALLGSANTEKEARATKP